MSTWNDVMGDLIVTQLNDGKRADCVTLTKKYDRRPPSKASVAFTRRSLGHLRIQLRKKGIAVTPVTEVFYKNNFDDGRELDDDAVEQSTARPGHPTYGLVLSADYPKLAIYHYNKQSTPHIGKDLGRAQEYELLIRLQIAKSEELIKPVLKFDQFEHLKIFLMETPSVKKEDDEDDE